LQEDVSERKPRKSVAFSEGATVMDENGAVIETPHVEKDTAEKHSAGMSFPLYVVSAAHSTFRFGVISLVFLV
jgi:hypothetical protein